MFLIVSFIIAGVAILMAVGVFAYSHFLESEANQKADELHQAEQAVDQDTVEGFLRLKNRLTYGQNLLDSHVALSQFLGVFENLTLKDVRFTTMTVTVLPDHSADLKLTGVAKDFNALAAQSAAFATEKRIKQAIFSGINSNKDGVTFSVGAKIDSRLVNLFAVGAAPELVPQASSTVPTAPVAPTAPTSTTTP